MKSFRPELEALEERITPLCTGDSSMPTPLPLAHSPVEVAISSSAIVVGDYYVNNLSLITPGKTLNFPTTLIASPHVYDAPPYRAAVAAYDAMGMEYPAQPVRAPGIILVASQSIITNRP